METARNRPPGGTPADEEFIDTLIAISVVAKRLAEKLRKQMEKEKALHCPRSGRVMEGRENGGFHYE